MSPDERLEPGVDRTIELGRLWDRVVARRRGMPAQLRIGVRKEAGNLVAHAWIECAGRTLLTGDAVDRYQALPLIAAGALVERRLAAGSENLA